MPQQAKRRRRSHGSIRVRAFSYRSKTGKVVHVKGFRRQAPGCVKRRIVK